MPDIVGIGTDMCEIARMERAVERAHFYERVFFPEERAYLETRGRQKAASAAAMFASCSFRYFSSTSGALIKLLPGMETPSERDSFCPRVFSS